MRPDKIAFRQYQASKGLFHSTLGQEERGWQWRRVLQALGRGRWGQANQGGPENSGTENGTVWSFCLNLKVADAAKLELFFSRNMKVPTPFVRTKRTAPTPNLWSCVIWKELNSMFSSCRPESFQLWPKRSGLVSCLPRCRSWSTTRWWVDLLHSRQIWTSWVQILAHLS